MTKSRDDITPKNERVAARHEAQRKSADPEQAPIFTPIDGLNARQGALLRRQQTHGNAAVRRMLRDQKPSRQPSRRVQRAPEDADSGAKPTLGITTEDQPTGGARVTSVPPNSPAAASLTIGDVITTANFQFITSSADLDEVVQSHQPGDYLFMLVQAGDAANDGPGKMGVNDIDGNSNGNNATEGAPSNSVLAMRVQRDDKPDGGSPVAGSPTKIAVVPVQAGPSGGNNPPPNPVPTAVNVRDWPTALVAVKRHAGKKNATDTPTAITKVKGKLELNIPNPDEAIPEGTDPQKAIIKQIKANRDALPSTDDNEKKLGDARPYNGDSKAGYQYGGAGSNKIKPKTTASSDQRTQEVMDAVHKEIGREGGWSAVNTYDDAVVTLGAGFTRSMLAIVMQKFFNKDADAKNQFLDVGVTWENNQARVVNTENGGIEEGDNGLRIIQLDKKILGLFITIAESAEHGQNLATAQDETIMGTAGKVPASVISDTANWGDLMTIRLVAHLIQWRSAKQWSSYSGCNGSVKEILKVAKDLNGKTDAKKGGARVWSSEQTNILLSFAGGKAAAGFDAGGAQELPADVAEGSMSNVTLFDAGGGKYYKMTD